MNESKDNDGNFSKLNDIMYEMVDLLMKMEKISRGCCFMVVICMIALILNCAILVMGK